MATQKLFPHPRLTGEKLTPSVHGHVMTKENALLKRLLMAYSKQYGLDVRVPRIFNSYGPRLREDGLYGRAMSRFILQALTNQPITIYGDGKQTRSFCYVTDTITGLLLLTQSRKAKGEVVNIGNAQEKTILELATKIKELTKCSSQ